MLDHIIHQIITPRKGTWIAEQLMKQNGVDEYDEWKILHTQMMSHEKLRIDKYPFGNSHQNFYFYKELAKAVNRYN